jgi:CheY-like chemotaxis protein
MSLACTQSQAAVCGPFVSPLPADAAEPFLPAEASRSTVLVVEDEPIVRLSVCDALEDAGLGVEEAADADRALRLLSKLGAERNPCRVLVTDVNLGVGPDGMALAAEARRNVPGLHVLYITGNPERVLKERPAPRDRECVLGKPFRNAELVAAVRRLAASSAACA